MSIERAKPLLGTVVSIRVEAANEQSAHQAIGRAFDEVGRVHDLMSFHQPDSDLSRLNREAASRAVEVDHRTYEVLAEALRVARLSEGAFDPTVAWELVRAGALPRPLGAVEPDPKASWRDVELLPGERRARFHRPLWLDLGGIAKGYAVDAACKSLAAGDVEQACVNAGGDLRVFGPRPEPVLLRADQHSAAGEPVLEIQNGAVAGSGRPVRDADGDWSLHLDGRSRSFVASGGFVAVAAERCMIADALTKVVMAACSVEASRVLRREDAMAYTRSAAGEWAVLEGME